MALPYEEGKAFIRTPDLYPHDAFGADTGGRTIPHSGIDVTPRIKGDTSARILAVTGGRVAEAGYDTQAGNYIIIEEKSGAAWGYGHNSRNLVKTGALVSAGQPIAHFGSTGGALGVHCHIWRGLYLSAALRIVHGYTNYKLGRTTKAWADSMGLSDPLPYILESTKNSAEYDNPATTNPLEEDDMYTDSDRARDDAIWGWTRDMQPKVHEILQIAKRLEVAAGVHTWALTDEASGLRRMVADTQRIVREQPEAVVTNVQAAPLTDDEIAAIAKAVVDLQHKRLLD